MTQEEYAKKTEEIAKRIGYAVIAAVLGVSEVFETEERLMEENRRPKKEEHHDITD